MRKINGIYVPGIGDENPRGQDAALRLYRPFGIHVAYHPVGWREGDFRPKLGELLDHIDSLSGRVALLGSSAGLSAVLHAYDQRPDKICAVVGICGKVQNIDTSSDFRYKENPALKQAHDDLPSVIDRLPDDKDFILSWRPLQDSVVPPADTRIEGAHNWLFPSVHHALSIGAILTAAAPLTSAFIRKHS